MATYEKKKLVTGRKVAIAIVALCWAYWLNSMIATPHIAHLRLLDPWGSAFMEQDNHQAIEWSWRPLSKISPYLQRAVVAAEDDQFYEHQGVDIEALKKAAKINWKKKRFSRGASTITMQLARNLYLSPDKSLFRKYQELLIALKLERELSKKRILELYLNLAEWGEGIYGAEAAARHYFKKSAANLSVGESAWLAAILPRPKYYDKHRGSSYARHRASVVAGRM